MKKLFLTGATGLVGGAILRYFHDAGWYVVVGTSTSELKALAPDIEIVEFQLDPTWNNANLEAVISDCDAVIHSAAIIPAALPKTPKGVQSEEWSNLFSFNSEGSFRLMDLAVKANIRSFINISTLAMFDSGETLFHEDLKPSSNNLYGLSKQVSELEADYFHRISGTDFFNLRIVAPYGFGSRVKAVTPLFVEKALNGQPLQLMGTGNREQVFTYVADIAAACDLAIEGGRPGTYNIAGPRTVTMTELANTVVKLVPNTDSKVIYSGDPDPGEGQSRRVSIEKAQRELNYNPKFDIADGLAEMIRTIQIPLSPLVGIE
jgi:UDP-N-acetylglucosamine/UDP-N-acetylgalactosamine 4-epimerase